MSLNFKIATLQMDINRVHSPDQMLDLVRELTTIVDKLNIKVDVLKEEIVSREVIDNQLLVAQGKVALVLSEEDLLTLTDALFETPFDGKREKMYNDLIKLREEAFGHEQRKSQ